MLTVINLLKSNSYGFIFRLIMAFSLPISLYLIPPDYFDSGRTICFVKNITGYDCPGCGMTRSLFHAIHFNIGVAIQYNKVVIIVLPLLIFLWGRIIYKSIIEIFLSDQNHQIKTGQHTITKWIWANLK